MPPRTDRCTPDELAIENVLPAEHRFSHSIGLTCSSSDGSIPSPPESHSLSACKRKMGQDGAKPRTVRRRGTPRPAQVHDEYRDAQAHEKTHTEQPAVRRRSEDKGSTTHHKLSRRPISYSQSLKT